MLPTQAKLEDVREGTCAEGVPVQSVQRCAVVDELALAAIEWEPLSLGSSWKFTLPAENAVGREFRSVEVSRTIDWQLKASASGESAHGLPVAPPHNLLAGQMITPTSELAAGTGSSALVLRDVHLGEASGNLAGTVRRDLRASSGRIVFGDLQPALESVKSCLVWCLNGPSDDVAFTTRTDRARVFRYERQRSGFPNRVRELKGSGFVLDSMPAPPPVFGKAPAALAMVPKGLPIDYALRPIAVEFSLEAPTSVPEWEQVDLYLASMSFVLGRRLIPVGFTLFDGDARQRVHELRSAWAVDLRSDCARQAMTPTPVTEGALATLAPRFVDRVGQFALTEAMWLVWLSEAVPLEAALPNLASALECLMTAWFKSTKTKSGAKYMPDADWNSISSDPMKSLAAALKGRPNADRIERRARGANNFGVNERFEKFFEELALPVGDVEIKAIGARNKAAHGGSFSASQYQWLADTVRAYRTLLSRVVLSLLEWDGQYVDYSTYAFPVRQLKEPLGGPAGDGQAAHP
jgi:hypothetical protein